MEIYDVVKKLTGPIMPVGETNEDNRRLDNLQKTISLVDDLMRDLVSVSYCKNNHQYSMKEAGLKAADYLNTVKAELQEIKE